MTSKLFSCIISGILLLILLNPAKAQDGDCAIEGIEENDWNSAKIIAFFDKDRDIIFSGKATNVKGIEKAEQSENLNSKEHYVTASLKDSSFILTLSSGFADYEKQETLEEFTMLITFTCSRQSRFLPITFKIKDTNNNIPEFLPGNNFEYKIFTPMPPGVPLSTLYGEIKVRDYDLTTSAIKFTIDSNEYLEMEYSGVDATKKIHTGVLKTKSAILGLEKPLVLKIFATDVDRTGDPPHTVPATITLTSDPVAQLPPAPQFSKTYYTGSIKNGELSFEEKIEISTGFTSDTTFSISEDKYFQVNNVNNVIDITIKNPIPEEVLENTDHFMFSLNAKKENTVGASATIYVAVPKDGQKILQFEKPYYAVSYLEDHSLAISSIKLTEEIVDVNFQLIGETSTYFTVSNKGSTVTITVKDHLTENIINSNSYIVLVLEAKASDASTGRTIINIDLPTTDGSLIILEFEKPNYDGKYLTDHSLELPTIKLTKEYSSVIFTLSGENGDNFSISNTGSTAVITLDSHLAPEVLNEKSFIVLVLEAQVKDAVSVKATISIVLPKKDTSVKVKFEKNFYSGSYAYSSNVLTLENIILEQGYNANTDFSLVGDNSELFKLESTDKTVTIKTKEDLSDILLEKTSVLVFSIQATRPDAYTATSVIAIKLKGKAGIPGNALSIVTIQEGKAYEKIEIGDLEDGCQYKMINNKWPSNTPDWFEIDPTGKYLKSNVVIREDPSVADLYLSQTQLELSVECRSTKTDVVRPEEEDEERFWISTKNVNYTPQKKIVTVVINDINNNPPIFDPPGPITLGFPTQSTAFVIRPQYLTTVLATDLDIGDNAKIKYTTNNDYFSVHPETGVVYPKNDFFSESFKESVSITIKATDRYGVGDGTNSAELKITVKPLEEADIAVVTIEDGVIENISEITETLSENIKATVNVLSSAVLPDPDKTTFIGRLRNILVHSPLLEDLTGDDTSLTMFVYALDSQNNILAASTLASQIGNTVFPWKVEGVTLTDSPLLQQLGRGGNSDNTGYIVGISILGVLLFLTIAGICAYYFIVVRKTYSSFTNSSTRSSVSSIESDNSSKKSSNLEYVDEVPSQIDNAHLASSLDEVINPGFKARDKPNSDQNGHHEKIKGSDSESEEDEFGEPVARRKSMVTFNEKVLQIDIDDIYEDERL